MTTSILLVDDESNFRERLRRAFEKREYQVFTAGDYDEAIRVIRQKMPGMAVVDLRMPGKSGLELIKDALTIHPEIRIVVLTGYGSIATATDAVKLGAVSYLPKPADIDDIITAFSRTTDLDLPDPEENFQAPSLARMEWEHINRVLHDCRGNISAAAKKLGLHRRTLQRKLNKFPPDN
ncbi:MAG: response regulator [Desulfobulbaceae bacterium]|nr:response regulator [Desulfobulbaceae bacterium]